MTLKHHNYLSSSPPGFEVLSFNWLDRQHSSLYSAVNNYNRTDHLSKKNAVTINRSSRKESSLIGGKKDDSAGFKSPLEMFTDSRLETTWDRSKDGHRIAEWERNYNCPRGDNCSCKHDNNSTSKVTKRVAFADELGEELVEVKVASECSNMPPSFTEGMLQGIKANLSDPPYHPPAPCQDSAFHLELINFSQPNLDLLSLHQRVQLIGIALASISFKPPSTLTITIETRSNAPCDRRVMVRYTMDGWKSIDNAEAVCLSSKASSTNDFYSFELIIPPTDHSIHLEFAINLKSFTADIWDNNDHCNYKVLLHTDPPLHHQPSYSSHESSVFFLDDLNYLADNFQAYW